DRRQALLLEAHDRRVRELLEVLRVDHAHLADAPVEDDRVGPHAAREEADALKQLAVGDAGRDETDVLAARELLRAVHLVRVGHTHAPGTSALVVVPELEPPEDLAADARERRRREHAFRRAAAPHHHVKTGAGDGDGERRDDVAVLDEVDARTGRADVVDELLVPRPVEDDDGEVLNLAPERVRHDLEVLGDRPIHVDLALRGRADHELLHVRVGRVEQAAALRHRHHRDRVRASLRHEVGALERIDRDVDLRTLAAAHLLADVQHRGLVALALPDDDGPPEGHLVHRLPHGLDRGLVGEAVVAVSDPMRGRDSGGLGDAHELEAWDATVGHGWTHRATRYRLLRAPAARASPPRPRCAAAGRASPP